MLTETSLGWTQFNVEPCENVPDGYGKSSTKFWRSKLKKKNERRGRISHQTKEVSQDLGARARFEAGFSILTKNIPSSGFDGELHILVV